MLLQSATLTWQGDLAFDAVAQDGHHLLLDGHEAGGPSPIDLLLMAQGGCSGMDVIAILQKKRQQVTGFELRLEGQRQEEHPRVYSAITITYILRGRALDRQAVERAIELSETKYCPVMAMLRQSTSITTRYEIVEETSTD